MRLLLASLALFAGTPATAAVVLSENPDNGHHYAFVSGSYSFDEALAAAAAATPMAGFTAHLATVTSQQENDFIHSLQAGNHAWLAGSDAGSEGVWRWVAGPEAGTIFYGPGAAPGAYANWNSATSEPNNAGSDEHYLHLHAGFSDGRWNDVFGTYTQGYILEYSRISAVPEPSTWAMMLVGFGAVGFAMRRKQKQVPALAA